MLAQMEITHTSKEYLAIEITPERKHEYINGEMIPMMLKRMNLNYLTAITFLWNEVD